jgi:DNA-binding IclR family transcriptional regulator
VAGDGTIGKACDVLEHVASFERPVRFAELLESSSFPKATLYRFLQSLTNQGMLAYEPDRQTYSPGLRLVRLAHTAWTQSSLAPIARPFLDGPALDRAVSQQSYHRFTDKTLTSEAALRADLELIRNRGYAIDDEEHEPGIICVACPVLTSGGRVLGAISVTGSTGRMDFNQLEAWVPRVRRVADQIATEAQAWRFPETRPNGQNDRMQST